MVRGAGAAGGRGGDGIYLRQKFCGERLSAYLKPLIERVAESSMVMPRLLLDLTFKCGLVFSTLWKRITDDEKRVVLAKKKAATPVKKKTQRKSVKKITKKVVKMKK